MSCAIKNEVFEIEQWFDPSNDGQYVKVRKHDKNGTKLGVIIHIPDSALFALIEGAYYPIVQLPKVRQGD